MRILQVTPSYAPGTSAVARYVANLSLALRDAGHEVVVLSGDAQRGRSRHRRRDGIEVHRLPTVTVGPLRVVPGLRRAVEEFSDDVHVVHVHDLLSCVPAQVLAAELLTPVVVSAHLTQSVHTGAAWPARLTRWAMLRRRLPEASAVMTSTGAESARLRAAFARVLPPVEVVPDAVRPLPLGLPAPARPDEILCRARLEPQGGVDVLIRALAQVPGSWHATIVGTGSQERRLRRLVDAVGLRSRITFTPTAGTAELDRLLATARVCVQPAADDHSGLAVLEAFGAGCAVVASDIPAHREAAGLAGADAALWAPRSGVEALARMVSLALLEPSGAVPSALPCWSQVTSQVVGLYEQALRSRWFNDAALTEAVRSALSLPPRPVLPAQRRA